MLLVSAFISLMKVPAASHARRLVQVAPLVISAHWTPLSNGHPAGGLVVVGVLQNGVVQVMGTFVCCLIVTPLVEQSHALPVRKEVITTASRQSTHAPLY